MPIAKQLGRLKESFKRVPIPILSRWARSYFAWRYQGTELRKYRDWLASGRPVPPPPLYKQMLVRSVGARFGIRLLIETGTFEGQMVEAVHRDFQRIYTIELDPTLYRIAKTRFADRPQIEVLNGDSAALLPLLLERIAEPAVFWLDAHYSEGLTARGAVETPIMVELAVIAKNPSRMGHVVLIDDARCFRGGAYPTVEQVGEWASANGFDTFEVEDDVLRIYNAVRPA